MKVDVYAEMYLWNRSADRLICVLERLEAFSICSKQRIKAYQVRLEEIRSGLNADLAEATAEQNAPMKVVSAGSEQSGKRTARMNN
ncbi:MAG TPA: hypothetical protein VGU63_00505 [Candidatus Acidoferrales bacterium]|nr:hypothetical protein [Candidatus Acidoferrales bacterium]